MLEDTLQVYFEHYLSQHSVDVKDLPRVKEILLDEIDYQMWRLLCDEQGVQFEKILKEEL